MDKNSEAYRSKDYSELFEASETSSLVKDEMVAYSQSYARLEEDHAAIAYNAEISREEGRREGRLEGRLDGAHDESVAIARNMIGMGLDSATIVKLTGLRLDEVNGMQH